MTCLVKMPQNLKADISSESPENKITKYKVNKLIKCDADVLTDKNNLKETKYWLEIDFG